MGEDSVVCVCGSCHSTLIQLRHPLQHRASTLANGYDRLLEESLKFEKAHKAQKKLYKTHQAERFLQNFGACISRIKSVRVHTVARDRRQPHYQGAVLQDFHLTGKATLAKHRLTMQRSNLILQVHCGVPTYQRAAHAVLQ